MSSRAGGKVAILMGARLVTRGAQLISFVLLARALSSEGFGAYGVVTSAIFLAGLLGNFGIRQSAAYMIGRKVLTDGEAGATALLFWPLSSVICGYFLWWFNAGSSSLLNSHLVVTVVIAGTAVLFLTFLQGVFLGRGEAGNFAVAETGPRVVQSTLVILLSFLDRLTIESALTAFAAGFAVFVPYCLWLAFRNAQSIRLRPMALPKMIRYGFLFSLSLFIIMLQGRVGLFFLHGSEGARAAGQFFAAQRVSEIFLDLATAAALVLFSETARATDTRLALVSAMRTASCLFVFFLLCGIAAAFAAPWLVTNVLGKGYSDAGPLLMILCFGLGPAAAARIMNSVVAGIGRPWVSAIVAFGGLMLNVCICYFAIPYWGAAAAAVALVAAQLLCCSAYLMICRLYFGLPLSALFVSPSELMDAARRLMARRPARGEP